MPGSDGNILTEVKAPFGLLEENSPFNAELLILINGVVSELQQLGVGPDEGLFVDENTTWNQLLVDDPTKKLQNVKTFMFLKVKMVFDSSNMPSHLVSAYERMIEEATFRITVAADPMLPWATEEPTEVVV